MFHNFTFYPYYDPSPPLWEVVANNMSSFWQLSNFQKGYIYVIERSLTPAEPILSGEPCLPVVHCSLEDYRGFTLMLYPCQGINLVALY